MNSYLTFAKYNGDQLGTASETFYVPYGTEAENYARGLAPDIYARRTSLDRAYIADQFTVLVPFRDMKSWRMANDVDKGTILGIPMRVVDGIDEPMIAFSPKRTEIPE